METTISGSVRSSAGCRYSADISFYNAHTGTMEGSLPPSFRGTDYFEIVWNIFLQLLKGYSEKKRLEATVGNRG